MNPWVTALTVFSVFLVWEEQGPGQAIKPDMSFLKRISIHILQIWVTVILLLAGYLFLIVPYSPEGAQPIYPFLFLAGAYAARLILRKNDAFVILTYGIASYQLTFERVLYVREHFISVTELSAGILIGALAFSGVLRRLRYSFIPAPMQGVPCFFLSAALYSLAVWGFQGFLP